METTINYAVVGFGPVIQGLVQIAQRFGGFKKEFWDLKWVGRSTGLYDSNLLRIGSWEAIFDRKQSRDLDVLFLGIPSSGDGAEAERFAKHFLGRGVVVETAEKALQACRPCLSSRYGRKFGYSATVGGNVGVLDFISRDPFGVTRVIGIPNTTFNYLRSRIVSGATFRQAITEAVELKFMESGDLQAELHDALLKSVILFNQVANLRSPLRFGDLKPKLISDARIQFALAMDCVCVVKISKVLDWSFVDSNAELMVCRCRRSGWQLEVFFQNTFALPFNPPVGGRNLFLITNQMSEQYQIFGQGAGVAPTAGTMFAEARALLGLN